jgi:5-oxoprolinase (ATP-hydrolysing)/N-methylhydantoinase A
MSRKTLLGVDTGGTFTDFAVVDPQSGVLTVEKVPTTPNEPALAIMNGIEALRREHDVALADVGNLVHATTLVTNALIERKGARLGLVTTRGFRDILEMRNEQRYDVYDLFLRFPEPLVPRHLRVEVDERVNYHGAEVTPVSTDDVRRAVETLKAHGVEAVAIAFLHSYVNPAHEEQVRELILAEWPELAAVSISSEVNPEIGEYERMSVTAANAYVQPLADAYLCDAEERLRAVGFDGSFFVMLSNGGISSGAIARRMPVRMVESGPAAGALCAARYARAAGIEKLVAFDMGGTTAKICLVERGEPRTTSGFEVARVHRFTRGSGLPLRVPSVELSEIGAGGGSIARLDEAGLLQVGPRSSGAMPGPACYGNGGIEPTVTDANLLLGFLSPTFFLGGRMSLDRDSSEQAIRPIAESLGVSIEEAAWGVHATVSHNMIAAMRVHFAERGQDPEEFTLMAFGGCGPTHALAVASALRIREVLVPMGAGVASALGAAVAPPAFDFAQSYVHDLADIEWADLETTYAQMEEDARAVLAEAGVPPDDVVFHRTADMRYVGQVYDIEVPIDAAPVTAEAEGGIRDAFEREYAQRYARAYPGSPIQITTCRLRGTGPAPAVSVELLYGDANGGSGGAVKGARPIYESPDAGWVDAAVYDRYALAVGDELLGPAVVEEHESTAVVPSGHRARVDDARNLRIVRTQ